MQALVRRRDPRAMWAGAALLAVLMASACTTSGATRPEPVESRDDAGFTISEDVHVSRTVLTDFERAMQLLEQERFDEGIALLKEVVDAAPDVTTAQINLGIAYGKVDDLEHAEASLQKALELSPRHPVALNELGMVYRRMGRFEDARKSYEKALAAYPDFHFARRNLAILCDLYLGDVDCALENYERYAAAVPDDEAIPVWIADLRNRNGR